jgi:hypothetical protein
MKFNNFVNFIILLVKYDNKDLFNKIKLSIFIILNMININFKL